MKKEYIDFEFEVIVFTEEDVETAGSCMANSSC